MKTRNILAAAAMTVGFSLTGLAQHTHGQTPQQEVKSVKTSDIICKPTAEQTVDGLRVQLWLITQDEHKKMMEERIESGKGEMKHEMMPGAKDSAMAEHKMGGGMQHDMKGMDHSKMAKDMKGETKEADHSKMMEAMMAGTHHLMVKVLDDKTSNAVGDGHIMVTVTAPSGKNSTTHVSKMMDHFGGGVSLAEKGLFEFAVSFDHGAKTHNAEFEYEVK
jgi:hypothetical protein